MTPADERADEPTDMDEAGCLFVLSLLMDGRSVDPGLERAARRYAASHPHCERVLADWREQAEALRSLPALRAGPGFTDELLARAGVGAAALAAPAEIESLRPFARQLAVAAGVALLLSVGALLARPADLRADAGIARHRHAVDGFRTAPFAPDDIEAGLRARLADAEFGARRGGRP